MNNLYIILMICEIIASIFISGVITWTFVDERKKKREPRSIYLITGIGALVASALTIFEVVYFVWMVIL